MKDLLNSFSGKTALVYGGAALLILVVGIRTVFSTIEEEGLEAITLITLLAIGIEFTLLLFYAHAIYERGESDSKEHIDVDLDFSELETGITTLENSIKSLNNTMEKVNNFDTELTLDTIKYEEISSNLINSVDNLGNFIEENNNYMRDVSESISDMKNTIQEHTTQINKLISGNIKTEIRNEIRTLLEKSLVDEN